MDNQKKTDEKSHKDVLKRKRRTSKLWLHVPKRRKVDQQSTSSTPVNVGVTTEKPSSSVLKRAPRKRNRREESNKAKKKLFKGNVTEELVSDLSEILPSVLYKVKEAGLLGDFCNMFRLINSGRLPLTNISLLLFMEVVRWYALDNTRQMQYSSECMKFWKVMYRLFHGKALRFMGGLKSVGEMTLEDTRKREFDPQKSSINFAVPTTKRVNDFEVVGMDIPKEVPPGIINASFQMTSADKSYVLSFDGKKVAPGLSRENGDQDLFGNEDDVTLAETKQRCDRELKYIEDTVSFWDTLPSPKKVERLEQLIKILSLRIKDLRLQYMKQQLGLKKFMKEGGDDWRNSKYVYAISAIQAQMFQIQTMVKRLLDANDSLLFIGATINGTESSLSQMTQIDIYAQSNLLTLRESDDIPEILSGDIRFVKQRSPKWFANREMFKLTGSKIFEGIGLDTLKKQQKHFDKTMKGITINEDIPEVVKQRMAHGTESEIHAIATLTSKVLPFYYPHMSYVEEGAHLISNTERTLMLVSPDGSLCNVTMDGSIPIPLVGCEFKCPVASDFKTPVHYKVPVRTHFDDDLWSLIIREAETLYVGNGCKRPTRISETSKEIKQRLVEYQIKHTEFICEVPSMKGTNVSTSFVVADSPYVYPVCSILEESRQNRICNNVKATLSNVSSCIRNTYLICRKKATEVLVWILADTDRTFNPEIPYSLPVAYAMKGYSLGVKPMRAMNETVLQSCYDNGIDVLCCCFDGQWVQIATRDKNDKPLTLIQLQRDVHREATKMTRDTILKLENNLIVTDVTSDLVSYRENKRLTISCPGLKRMVASMRIQSKTKNKDNKKETSKPTDTLSCLPDEALEALISKDSHNEFETTEENIESEQINYNLVAEEDSNSDTIVQQTNTLDVDGHGRQVMFDNIAVEILQKFKEHSKNTISKKWKEKKVADLQTVVNDINQLIKLTHEEMNLIIEGTSSLQKESGIIIKRSLKSVDKANAISRLIGNGMQIHREKTVKSMQSLKSIAVKALRSSPKYASKELLNNVVSAKLFEKRYSEWLGENPFKDYEIQYAGTTRWFSYPEYDESRQKLEPKCLDAHHLLVNLRVKVCKDGVTGIRKRAWHTVAETNNDVISKGIVVDLLDKQNNAFAKRTFSAAVEDEMRRLSFHSEADFCKLIRRWYEAEDSPGLSAQERIKRRLELKNYLLKDVDFGCFPPPGMYVKGFPKVIYEGFLQRIDTTIQLYSTVKSGTYNQRAVSSLVNETFFGELSEMEPTKLGCPKAISIPRLMATVTELQHFRHDPSERTFKINTSKRPVYPQTKLLSAEHPSTGVDNEEIQSGGQTLKKIFLRIKKRNKMALYRSPEDKMH